MILPRVLQLLRFTFVVTFCIMKHNAVQNSLDVQYPESVNLVHKILILSAMSEVTTIHYSLQNC
jgi:hypothetical protein